MTSAVAVPVVLKCHACDASGKGLESCVGCGRKTCATHRGDKGGDYRSAGGKEGYACCECIAGGSVRPSSTYSSLAEVLAFILTHRVVPKVMAEVDQRLVLVRDEIAPPLIDAAAKQAEALVAATLTHVDARMDKAQAELLPAIRTEIEALVAAALVQLDERLVLTRRELLPAVREQVDGLVADALARVDERLDRIEARLVPALRMEGQQLIDHTLQGTSVAFRGALNDAERSLTSVKVLGTVFGVLAAVNALGIGAAVWLLRVIQ